MTLFYTTPANQNIAYRRQFGEGEVGVLFLHGWRSDMESTKATELREWCAQENVSFTALDCFAHGKSDGDFMDFTIGRAIDSVLEILDHVAQGPHILVGSSMGGWVGLHVALQRKGQIRGLVGISAAPDFTDQIRGMMNAEQQAEIDANGHVWAPGDFGPDYPITQAFLDNGRELFLLNDVIGLEIPIHLFQGMQDASVPWQTPLKLAEKITGDEMRVTLVKDADHRFNRPQDMAMVKEAVRGMLAR